METAALPTELYPFVLLPIIYITGSFVKIKINKLIKLIFNSILGGVLIYFINNTGLIHIGLNVVNSLFVGICGLPGALLLIILKIF